ncbi:MAG: cytochrome family [Acetobacteraceae bacterium]|jgi:cytochrome P450|nr:cytochrome family [Acetobacteraceae bacterium]
MEETLRQTDQTIHRLPATDLPVLSVAELDADPHGVFRRYRPTHPVVAHEKGGYLVLRYADVEHLSRNPRVISTETAFPEIQGVTEGPLFDGFRYGMLTANGAVHQRRRSPFTRTFAARLINEMRPAIRRSAEQLIDAWCADGQVEFIGNFAAPLPAQVISDLLGLKRADIPNFTKLVYEVTRFISFSIKPDEIPGVQAAEQQLQDYVERTLEERRRSPRGDFLSSFLAATDEAADMSPLEVLFQIVQLIVGGTDTTRVAIAVQVALLLQHHEQWTAVCHNPELIPNAVAEAMRFEPSVASAARMAAEDIELGGAVLPAGSFITLSTMSGMRDEQVYDRPDVFDIHRTGGPRLHPIFGGGAHRCIGEALARAELEETLGVLITRIPQLRLDQAPTITGHSGIRRIDAMRISWPTS